MKKFIIILIGAIVMFSSCTSKVEKDIVNVVGTEVKVCDVKSVDIKSDFYTITNEYTENRSKYENCREITRMDGDMMRMFESDMKLYKSWGNSFEKDYTHSKEKYEEYKKSWEDDCKRLEEYSEKNKYYEENGSQTGKVYIAKIKTKNEYNGKFNDFCSYPMFAYDSDGTLHQTEADDYIQMVCAVYPEAKKDLQKAMEVAAQSFVDALSSLSFD